MASKVLLHVGTPKSGTSFVQDLLFSHREALRDEGLLYAADRFDAHFLAALDLMQLPWGGLEREAIGRWDALAAQVREYDGVAVISHEIFGRASRLQVARVLESLGDAEVHIVLSARDLARQLPAEWQENIKHRRTIRFDQFIAKMQDPARESEIAQWFWAVQEVPDILDRWGSRLPKEHVHLITVPKSGAAPELLWQRFAGVLGIDPERYVPAEEPVNASLGVPEAALIRRLNKKVNTTLPSPHYRAFVRELLVHQHLSHERSSARLALPADVHEWANQLSRSWVAEVALRGYDVVGELDDLLPADPGVFVDPDRPDEAQVADAGVRALAVSIAENARLREVEIELHEILDDVSAALDRARSTRIYRAKEKFVRKSETNVVLRLCLRIYRRLRNSSRSA